jgi:hypothetical protein
MKISFLALPFLVLVLCAPPVAAQGRKICGPNGGRCVTILPPSVGMSGADRALPIPRTAEGKPDFTGVYAGAGFTHQVGPGDTDEALFRGLDASKIPPLTPLGQQRFYRPWTGDLLNDDPTSLCLPWGFIGQQVMVPYAQQWIQSPKYLVIRHEFMNNFSRVIPLDGSPHPKDLDPTWGGDSRGHWEGDTLVIDTIGFKETYFGQDGKGSMWSSDALHVIERVKFISPRVLSYEVTYDDPKFFTKPWSEEYDMLLHPTWNLLEFVCKDSDRCSQGHCSEIKK